MAEIIPLACVRAGGTTSGRLASDLAAGALQRVYVLFTDLEETVRAVRVASRLARTAGGCVTVVHLRPIGFGAPVDHPTGLSPVETDAFKARLAVEDVDARARVCVCRNPRQALRSVIDRHSLVVIGKRRGWWPTPSNHWRRVLEDEGYVVVLANDAAGDRDGDE